MSLIAIGLAIGLLQEPAQRPNPREELLGHFRPWAVLEVNPSLRLNSEVYSLYAPFSASPQDGGHRYVVWRRLSRHRMQPDKIEWAKVSDCPGAEASIIELENLPLPQVDVPMIGREDDQGPPLDGVGYDLWFQYGKWPDGFAYSASVSANVETPLADWAERFIHTMRACWSAEQPPAWNSLS